MISTMAKGNVIYDFFTKDTTIVIIPKIGTIKNIVEPTSKDNPQIINDTRKIIRFKKCPVSIKGCVIFTFLFIKYPSMNIF